MGATSDSPPADDDVDLLVVPAQRGDPRVELAGTEVLELAHIRTLVAVGDDVVSDPRIISAARKLATHLGARMVGSPAASHAGAVEQTSTIEPTTALAPELCIIIGAAKIDLAGATRVIQLGPNADKHVDGVLATPITTALDELLARLGVV
jgi:hypothetical protein